MCVISDADKIMISVDDERRIEWDTAVDKGEGGEKQHVTDV